MNKLIFTSVIALLIIGSSPAFGLKLLTINDDNTTFQTATFIPDSSMNSYFTLEKFEREGQSHWYSFVGQKGMVISIKTLVPDIASSRDFSPSFDLIIGQDKVTPESQKTMFHEELTNTDWFITAELKMTLPSDGLYYIRAHDDLQHYSKGDTGKFSMFIGEMDNLTLFDWIQVPFWILAVNQFFENFTYVWIMLVLLFTIVVIVFVTINRRGKN